MTGHENDRVNRLRAWMLTLIVIVVFAAFLAPIGVISWLERRVDEAQFEITCTSAHSNISQLEALTAISRRLGLPRDFEVPPLPEECT